MKENKLVDLYYYQNYMTGRFYYFLDREMAEYDRYLQAKRFEHKKAHIPGFKVPIGQVCEMCVLESDVEQFKPTTDLGVEICLDDEMGM